MEHLTSLTIEKKMLEKNVTEQEKLIKKLQEIENQYYFMERSLIEKESYVKDRENYIIYLQEEFQLKLKNKDQDIVNSSLYEELVNQPMNEMISLICQIFLQVQQSYQMGQKLYDLTSLESSSSLDPHHPHQGNNVGSTSSKIIHRQPSEDFHSPSFPSSAVSFKNQNSSLFERQNSSSLTSGTDGPAPFLSQRQAIQLSGLHPQQRHHPSPSAGMLHRQISTLTSNPPNTTNTATPSSPSPSPSSSSLSILPASFLPAFLPQHPSLLASYGKLQKLIISYRNDILLESQVSEEIKLKLMNLLEIFIVLPIYLQELILFSDQRYDEQEQIKKLKNEIEELKNYCSKERRRIVNHYEEQLQHLKDVVSVKSYEV
jgi:hypothetical protein